MLNIVLTGLLVRAAALRGQCEKWRGRCGIQCLEYGGQSIVKLLPVGVAIVTRSAAAAAASRWQKREVALLFFFAFCDVPPGDVLVVVEALGAVSNAIGKYGDCVILPTLLSPRLLEQQLQH